MREIYNCVVSFFFIIYTVLMHAFICSLHSFLPLSLSFILLMRKLKHRWLAQSSMADKSQIEAVIQGLPRTPGKLFLVSSFNTTGLGTIGKMAIAQTKTLYLINLQMGNRICFSLSQYVFSYVSDLLVILSLSLERCPSISYAITALLSFSLFILIFLRIKRAVALPSVNCKILWSRV